MARSGGWAGPRDLVRALLSAAVAVSLLSLAAGSATADDFAAIGLSILQADTGSLLGMSVQTTGILAVAAGDGAVLRTRPVDPQRIAVDLGSVPENERAIIAQRCRFGC